MNLSDFEEYFSPRILERGKNYYQNHHVISLESIGNGSYEAEVEGSEIYTVFAELKADGEVLDLSCDCPYEWEEFCKHEAAVLYALREQEKIIPPVEEPEQKQALPEQLAACEKETLIAWMMEYAKENRGFLDYLQLHVSEQLQSEELLAILNRTCNRFFSGKIVWKELQKTVAFLLESMQSWKDDAEKVKTGASMIRLLKKWYQTNSCESDWIVYDEIDVCSDALMQIVQDVVNRQDRKAAESIYQILLKMLQVDFVDIENPFSPMLNALCALLEYRKKFETWLQYRQGVTDGYEKREWERQQFQILKRYGTPQEQNDFINRHLSNPEYRRMAIQNAIDAGDESTVERLALDGEYENQALPGLLQEWQKCRYHCYHRTGEREKLADVCEALLKGGEPDYYEEWKSLIPFDLKSVKIEQLLKEVPIKVYRRILLAENRVDLMAEACEKDPSELWLYFGALKSSPFAERATELYEDWIWEEADAAANRSEYAAVCRKLKKFSENSPIAARVLAQELREKFPRRPAFQDELKKAGF